MTALLIVAYLLVACVAGRFIRRRMDHDVGPSEGVELVAVALVYGFVGLMWPCFVLLGVVGGALTLVGLIIAGRAR